MFRIVDAPVNLALSKTSVAAAIHLIQIVPGIILLYKTSQHAFDMCNILSKWKRIPIYPGACNGFLWSFFFLQQETFKKCSSWSAQLNETNNGMVTQTNKQIPHFERMRRICFTYRQGTIQSSHWHWLLFVCPTTQSSGRLILVCIRTWKTNHKALSLWVYTAQTIQIGSIIFIKQHLQAHTELHCEQGPQNFTLLAMWRTYLQWDWVSFQDLLQGPIHCLLCHADPTAEDLFRLPQQSAAHSPSSHCDAEIGCIEAFWVWSLVYFTSSYIHL